MSLSMPRTAPEAQTGAAPPAFVVTAEGELHGEDSPENRELARRIRACVNACEGLSTDDLEAGVVTQMLKIVQTVGPLLNVPTARLADAA